MDHFESIVCTLLEAEGYWVRRSFKVNLTKEEKRNTGKHSIPRPEIDIRAMKVSTGEVLAIEVKSFFDSRGVSLKHLENEHDICKDGTSRLLRRNIATSSYRGYARIFTTQE